jgi:hypothetical protein
MAATLGRGEDGGPIRKAGVMGIVLAGGAVRPGDPSVSSCRRGRLDR